MNEQARLLSTKGQRQQMIDNDFGFTVVTHDELDSVKDLQSTADKLELKLNDYKQRAILSENRITNLIKAISDLRSRIQPLLDSLKSNPNKDELIIKWPNRLEKITEFEDRLDELVASAIRE